MLQPLSLQQMYSMELVVPVCQTYELFNGLASDITINYLTCVGNGASVTIPGGGGSVIVCMRADSNTGKDFDSLVATLVDCGCVSPL